MFSKKEHVKYNFDIDSLQNAIRECLQEERKQNEENPYYSKEF
jgi:hypothetical protein